MRVEIAVAESGRIRIVPDLNVGKVTLLEGLNGIGKSTAIRLLMVCAGTLPYGRRSRAWSTLAAGIGPASVAVSDLVGAEQIRWQFDTRSWPIEPDTVEDSWFTDISIDDKPASLADVRKVLSVHRFAGDVNVVDALAEQVEHYADVVSKAQLDADSATRPSESAVALLSNAARVADSVDFDLLSSDQSLLQVNMREHESVVRELNMLSHRLQLLSEASENAYRVAQFEAIGPNLEAQLADVERDLKVAKARRDVVYRQLEEAAVAAEENKTARAGLASAQRRLERNQQSLQHTLIQRAEILDELELPSDSDLATVASSEAKAREELAALVEARRAIDASPYVQELLHDLRGRLHTAAGSGLASERILADTDVLHSSVEAVYSSMGVRLAELEAEPPLPGVRDVHTRLERIGTRVATFERLPAIDDAIARFRRLAQQAEADIEQLGSGPLESSTELVELRRERDELDQQIVHLATERARFARQRGLLGENARQAYEQALQANLQAAELADVQSIGPALEAATQRERSLLGSEERVAAAIEDLRHRLSERENEALAAAEQLRSAEEFHWLRSTLPDHFTASADGLGGTMARLGAISRACAEAIARIERVQIDLLSVERALQHIGGRLRGRDVDAANYVSPLTEWFEAVFSAYFSSDPVRRELLPEAADIQVDLENVSLRWTRNGESETTALEAFSSGEQAFAFTRARLGLLDVDGTDALNRLICLDEFGAFMAEDRQRGLLTYLRDRAKDHGGDRVLLVLPVRQDYEQAAQGLLGEQRTDFIERASALKDFGFVQETVLE